jgi:DNA mismatch repair protein MutL
MPIRALDPKVVAQIAAGEVVERPASVVKELVENSLDAGSSQISVEVKGGGVSLIRVTDNGTGIPSGEVRLAFDRYATSKVANLDDLESIQSLGFRGEALPSIAAVAQVDMVSCATGEKAGVYLSLQDGIISSQGSRARSQGTTVTVSNLFRKIPARLKFLKSVATESGHIANVVSQYALAFPEVKFSLSIDNRIALRTPGSGQLIDSIAEVYGTEVAGNVIEFKTEAPALLPRISGLIGSPKISRSGRGNLSFFVNRRWVNSRLLARAVEEAYHGLLMVGKHPIAIINISLPPQEVDVNIHPTKSEVKFRNDSAIFSMVQRAVRRALTEQITVPLIKTAATEPIFPTELREVTHAPYAGVSQAPSAPTPALSLPVLRVLGQLDNSYIVAEGPEGLYLIDQHAAHERILFEKLSQQRVQRKVEVQGLLEPITLEISPRQEAILKSRYQDLAEFGFAIEPFGDRTFIIRALPAMIHDKDWAGVLQELLDSLSQGNKGDWSEDLTITMACHGAIRAGQSLTDAEMRELVRQLEQCASPHTCPHGRPTMIHLSSSQLKKEFGRT